MGLCAHKDRLIEKAEERGPPLTPKWTTELDPTKKNSGPGIKVIDRGLL